MANISVEIINLTNSFNNEIKSSIKLANNCQSVIKFEELDYKTIPNLEFLRLSELNTKFALDQIDKIRNQIRGFHPFILLITDAYLYNDLYNIFGSNRAESGLGILTTHSVPEIIIPKDKIEAYFVYYYARYTLSYFNPEQKNHTETRNCLYDKKIRKTDILQSMKKGAFCDECKKNMMLSEKSRVNDVLLSAINAVLGVSEQILYNVPNDYPLKSENNNSVNIAEVKECVADAKIIQAFELLQKHPSLRLDNKIQNSILVIRNRYNSLTSDFNLGIVAYEVFTLERTKLVSGFLGILDEFEKN